MMIFVNDRVGEKKTLWGEKEKMLVTSIFSFSPQRFKRAFVYRVFNPFITRRQILDSSKLKEIADDNFKFDENGRKLSKRVENAVGKKEKLLVTSNFSFFPTVFSKSLFPRGVKRCHCVGMG